MEHGIPSSARVNQGLLRHPRADRDPARARPTTRTTCTRTTTRRTTCCSASARARRSRTASGCASTRSDFYLKTAEEMARPLPGPPRGARARRWRSRRCATSSSRASRRCRPSTCRPGFTIDALLREGDARRLRRARAGARAARGLGPAASPARRLRGAARQGDRRHPARGLRGLLPDRLGLHPLRARAGDPGRAGPRLGRRRASSPTRCASPTSTRSSTTCSSSAS